MECQNNTASLWRRKNIIRRFLFSVVLLTASSSNVFAERTIKFLNDYISRVWTSKDGLPGNTITDVIQSKEGYLLIGTYEGLVRFDGVKIVTLNRNYDSLFDFVSARAMYQAPNGELWVGSNDNGLCILRNNWDNIKLTIADGLPNNSIRDICSDKNGNVWIGTASGVAYVTPNYKVCIPAGMNDFPKQNSYLIKHIFCDADGKIWITTGDENSTFCYENGKIELFELGKEYSGKNISCVYQDREGAFWFGLDARAALRISGDKKDFFDLSFGQTEGTFVNCIFEDSKKNIWFATDNGAAILHNGALIPFSMEEGLADENVLKIIEDKESNIWFATDRGGIQRLAPTKFNMIKTPSTVNAVAWDFRRHVMWVATDKGLFCQNGHGYIENKLTEFCHKVRIRDVSVTPEGSVLVSTHERLGQLEYKSDGTIVSWKKSDGLAGERVRVALKHSNGDLYVGTASGVSIVDAKDGSIQNFTKENGFENDYIMCITEDSDGKVWIGTDGCGVYVLNNRHLEKNYKREQGLAGDVIFKIYQYDDEMWICTGTGLSVLKNNKFTNIDLHNGLGTDSVFQSLYDGKDTVWCACNGGIFSISKEEVENCINGISESIESKYYNRADGIDSFGVTPTSRAFFDPIGLVWFSMLDGFCVFDYRKISSDPVPPFSIVELIRIDDERQIYNFGEIVVPAKSRRVSIDYTGISFVSPEEVTFSTKLEGFDDAYTPWKADRMVSYTNLKPGTYKFSVLSKNGDDIISDPLKPVTIIVQPAFYEHWWFWGFIIIALLVLIYILFQQRLLYLRRTRTRLEFLVQERTKELKELQYNLEQQVKDRTVELRHEKKRLQKFSMEVTKALVGTIDAKDKYTSGHSTRVAEYSRSLALAIGKTQEEAENVYYAALLHDIGKIGVPDTIINKKDKLTDEEYEIVKQHPVIGGDILKTIESMPEVSLGARWHHERYDGRGYPDHLKGNDIPEIARIIGVADSYDAMTSNRSYRKYLPQNVVRAEIEKGKGSQFDPIIAEKMLEIIDSDKEYKFHE